VRCFVIVNEHSPHGAWAWREIMRPAFRALRADYGLTAEPLAFGEVPLPRPDLVSYAIYGPTDPLEMGPEEREYLAALAIAGVNTNIISAYPLTDAGTDRAGYERAAEAVPRLCDELDINAIYPDVLDTDRGIRTNNWQDVYINVIGETIRVKYHPVQSHDEADAALLGRLRREHAEDVAELARLHREHHLWQRKPYTDGSIMLCHDGHWFASQTVTDKTLMTADDFDLITAFDEGRRTVTYAGQRLPTSDAPEFLLLSSLLARYARQPRLIVHFHHRELTRGPRFRELVTDANIEGGHFSAGRRYYAELRRRGSNWFIIREHGMVWVGDSVAEFAEYVRQTCP
jgi:hypothetical protein